MRKKNYKLAIFNGSKKDVNISIALKNDEQYFLVDQAMTRYTTSKAWIHMKYVYIWKYAYKAYHLSTEDRQRVLKDWQSNIAWGLIRSFIDVFVSTLTERPINFSVQGLNEEGLKNAENIRHALSATADVTGFQKEVRYSMKEGLKTGTFAFAIGMLPDAKKMDISIFTDDEKTPIIEAQYENEIGNFPTATAIDVFNIFPDVYNGTMRYVTHRKVTSLNGVLTSYGALINSDDNESPLKDYVQYITREKNRNGADFKDYAIIKDQIHQQINWNHSKEDSFPDVFSNKSTTTTTNTQDQDADVTDGLIECLYTTDDTHIILHLNGYPVYIGPNTYGFIPFVLSSINDEKQVMGCEGIAYLLAGMEKTMNSFMNNYLDGVKVVATPSYVVRKGLFIDEDSLENQSPGSLIYSEGDIGENAIRRMDKGTITDHNILDITIKIASQLTGISEYNLGVSSKERTATGSNALTQSSQKRLSPFLETFVSVVSRVANMWLILMRQHWTEEKFLIVTGSEEGKSLKNKDLVGATSITLNSDSMFSVMQDFAYKKILEVYGQVKGTGLVNEDEIVKEIIRVLGYDSKRFVPITAPKVTTPPELAPPPVTLDEGLTPEIAAGQDLGQMISPQLDLGNGGQGPQ